MDNKSKILQNYFGRSFFTVTQTQLKKVVGCGKKNSREAPFPAYPSLPPPILSTLNTPLNVKRYKIGN